MEYQDFLVQVKTRKYSEEVEVRAQDALVAEHVAIGQVLGKWARWNPKTQRVTIIQHWLNPLLAEKVFPYRVRVTVEELRKG